MSSRTEQEEYLASVAQAFDVGDFDYLPPEQMQSLNALIAAAWQAFRQGEAIDSYQEQIEQAINSK
jgi:non-homologous end joining protein Ku